MRPGAIAGRLFRIGRPAAPAVRAALTASAPLLRANAARVIGVIADPSHLDELVALLSDEASEVRLAAIAALGDVGGPAATRLLDILPVSDIGARVAVIRALTWSGHPQAVRALTDPDPPVRRVGIDGVVELGLLPQAEAVLRPLSSDPDVIVRLAALDALTTRLDAVTIEHAQPGPDAIVAALNHNDQSFAPSRHPHP